jgi:small multidrug resistance pump
VIPLGITYALWSGLGTVAVVCIGAFAYKQVLNPSQLLGVALIVAGVVLVNLKGTHAS